VIISGTTQFIVAVLTSPTDLSGFIQIDGSNPSSSQTYTVSGTNLIDNVVVTPPTAFEISTNGGSTWNGSSSPITLSQTSGGISGQLVTISVRLNASAPGLYTGVIIHTSTGAPETDVAISGVQLAVEPDAASSLSFSHVTGSSMTIGFTGGNGDDRMAVIGYQPTEFRLEVWIIILQVQRIKGMEIRLSIMVPEPV
jgi:hypothetical protein